MKTYQFNIVMAVIIIAIISIPFIIFFTIPNHEPDRTTTNLGKLITLDIVPTAWNDCTKCRVETDKGIFILWNSYSGNFGEDVIVEKRRVLGLEERE